MAAAATAIWSWACCGRQAAEVVERKVLDGEFAIIPGICKSGAIGCHLEVWNLQISEEEKKGMRMSPGSSTTRSLSSCLALEGPTVLGGGSNHG